MKIRLVLLLWITGSVPAFALSRHEIIAQQMDCIAAHKQANGITWNEVCTTVPQDDHMQAVNAALDQKEHPAAHVTPQYDAQPIYVSKRNDRLLYRSFDEIDPMVKQRLDPRHVHTFDVGVEPYFYQYEEGRPIKNSGMMMGYYGKYAFRPPDNNILNNAVLNAYMFEGRFALGDLDYKGSGTVDNKRNTNYELRGLLGKDYLLWDRSMVMPYFGFGYRYLLDKGDGRLSSTNKYGYDRHSNYFYVPLGFTGTIPRGAWTTEINGEYDILIQGIQVSDLSNGDQFTGFDNPNIRNYQTNGFGVRGSLKFIYSSRNARFYFEPFVRYWNISRSSLASATVDGFYSSEWNEPKNTTLEIGSRFGVQF